MVRTTKTTTPATPKTASKASKTTTPVVEVAASSSAPVVEVTPLLRLLLSRQERLMRPHQAYLVNSLISWQSYKP